MTLFLTSFSKIYPHTYNFLIKPISLLKRVSFSVQWQCQRGVWGSVSTAQMYSSAKVWRNGNSVFESSFQSVRDGEIISIKKKVRGHDRVIKRGIFMSWNRWKFSRNLSATSCSFYYCFWQLLRQLWTVTVLRSVSFSMQMGLWKWGLGSISGHLYGHLESS